METGPVIDEDGRDKDVNVRDAVPVQPLLFVAVTV